MEIKKVKQFAIEQGYDNALPLGKWKGFDIYEPVFDSEETSFIGLPLLIMVKGDTIRMSTPEESLEQLNS